MYLAGDPAFCCLIVGWCFFLIIAHGRFSAVRVSGCRLCDISGMNINTENIGYFFAVVE
jgi:hypothetical protein